MSAAGLEKQIQQATAAVSEAEAAHKRAGGSNKELHSQLLLAREKALELRVERLIQQSVAKESLWDVLNRTVPDDVFAEHGRPQTMPIAGGRTADTLGKWNLPAEVKDWVVREYIAEKLRAVPLTALVQDQKCSASGGLLTHEEMLYPALDNAVYAPVNQAAKHLGLNLKYGQSHGHAGITEVDLRAIDTHGQRTYIPHEVKGPWAEQHAGGHFSELLQDQRKRRRVDRAAAQILYYMVEEGAVYGILSSKRHHIFVRRPADAASRHADFSDTFDSELQTAPSLRLMYLYLLKLAQNTPQLDPSLRPTTAAELKWACVNTKRKRSERVVNDPVADPGDSDDDAEDDKWDAASGNAGDKSDDADIINSEGTTGADGPSAHTRSKDVKSSVQHTSVKTRNVSRKHALYTSRADCEQLLTQLPLFARPSLDFNTIRIGKNYVVRRGKWHNQAAVFKVWNLGDSLQPLLSLQTEICAYDRLISLQGVHIPRLLAKGTYHRGLAAFITTEAGGGPLSIETLRSRPQLAEKVLQSLAAVHQRGVLHGDVQLHNFVLAPDNTTVWLLDFEHSCWGEPYELKWERESLLDLLDLQPESC